MFSNFLSSLTSMSKPWQVVDEHGEIVEKHEDSDDVSSISSDWSFMQADGESGWRSRSESPHVLIDTPTPSHDSSNRSPNAGRSRHQSLPNSMDSPVRPDTDDHAVATSTRSTGLSRSARRSKGTARSDSVACTIWASPNPVQSRQVNARWNGAAHSAHRKGHRNTLNVDVQRAKCLRRGPQTSRAYQRKQVSLLAGGQLPPARRN